MLEEPKWFKDRIASRKYRLLGQSTASKLQIEPVSMRAIIGHLAVILQRLAVINLHDVTLTLSVVRHMELHVV